MIEITSEPLDFAALAASVRTDQAGAVCVFMGTVREMTAGRRTVHLEYEAHVEMACKQIGDLETEARARWPILEAALAHRVGKLELGAISVVVAVSCPHRADAFEACRWLIDELKRVVPIWKKEVWADGEQAWIHPGLNT